MLSLKDVSFSYEKHEKPILSNTTLELEEGKVGVLLGPNGVGKSTIIKIISGLIKPKTGDIFLGENDFRKIKIKERAKLVSYVPQNVKFSSLSVLDSVLLGRLPYFYSFPCAHDKAKAEKAIEEVGLSSLKDRPANSLSGGEKQLVSIARALVSSPSLLLLDEPTANLDLRHQKEVLTLLKKIAKEKKLTILLSLHDISEAFYIGDKFFFLKNGKIIDSGDSSIITEERIKEIYDTDVKLIKDNDGYLVKIY